MFYFGMFPILVIMYISSSLITNFIMDALMFDTLKRCMVLAYNFFSVYLNPNFYYPGSSKVMTRRHVDLNYVYKPHMMLRNHTSIFR